MVQNKKKIVAILPAKGNSERIDNKNCKLLDGKELFLHTLQKLLECEFIDEVYLDSESENIFEIASELKHNKLIRNPNLASNKTDGNKLFMNEVENIEADIYIQILCTSPFIEKETIKKGIDILVENNNFDSAVLVKKDKQYTWNKNGPIYNIENIPNSKDLDDTIIETMGLYIVKKETAIKYNRRIGAKPYLLEATPLESIDVNYPEDFKLAELIQAGKREKEIILLKNFRNRLTSSMLSDILDEFEINGVIRNLKPNFDKKIFGRAKTLKIRKLKQNEDFRGIYKALESYEKIIPNDIIIVENEISDYAYFGELNANLAIRSGASAAIIGGMTRDSKEVLDLNFPVFSKGTVCKDVKNRATVESINKKIYIEGVEIYPEDLIFGDRDGIIIIPKKYEEKILERAFEVMKAEKQILVDIAKGENIHNIINNNGFF